MSFWLITTIFLVAATLTVPLFKRCGLGAVLGYLAAGLAVGPSGFELIDDVEGILHIGEFGVVLLLFIIGLELSPKRLWTMRRAVFGLGGFQVGITALIIAAITMALGYDLATAALTGLGLSLSSTAFALQTLAEKHELSAPHGRAAFSVLLFQDLAVIPILALMPVFAAGHEAVSLDPLAASQAIGAVAVVVVGGRLALRVIFRRLALLKLPEIFTAMGLLTVTGTALLMEHVGLSMGLGAFLAGLLLADSEYRHELEATIEPFKGLLLGLFFMAVGMSVNMGLLTMRPELVLSLVAGLLLLKFAVLFVLGRTHGLKSREARRLGLAISQGGEFAFVILGAARAEQAIDGDLVSLLILAVTLSMVCTPLLLLLDEKLRRAEPEADKSAGRKYDQVDQDHPVIIAGFGRVGQIVGRILLARKIGFTALEANPDQVDFVRRYGNIVHYGDAGRVEILRAAGADKARLFILAIDDVDASLRIAGTVRKHFPDLKILARARNRNHVYRLADLGIRHIWREAFYSSMEIGREALYQLGFSSREAESTINRFRHHDESRLRLHYAVYQDKEKLMEMAWQSRKELEELFEEDDSLLGDDDPDSDGKNRAL